MALLHVRVRRGVEEIPLAVRRATRSSGTPSGIDDGLASPASTTPSTLGMTPPRRTSVTFAPSVSPSFAMNATLCSDARDTETPDRNTGSTIATGVMAPVRATDHSTCRSTDSPESHRDLYASARAGGHDVLAEAPLLFQLVDLEDDAVDLVVERRAGAGRTPRTPSKTCARSLHEKSTAGKPGATSRSNSRDLRTSSRPVPRRSYAANEQLVRRWTSRSTVLLPLAQAVKVPQVRPLPRPGSFASAESRM